VGVSWAFLGLVYRNATHTSGPSACDRNSFHLASLTWQIVWWYALRSLWYASWSALDLVFFHHPWAHVIIFLASVTSGVHHLFDCGVMLRVGVEIVAACQMMSRRSSAQVSRCAGVRIVLYWAHWGWVSTDREWRVLENLGQSVFPQLRCGSGVGVSASGLNASCILSMFHLPFPGRVS
jgi:hypothetical protein